MATFLTTRCDPYGAESSIRLLGGTLPENMAGRIHWKCEEQAEARYRFYCRGGQYGERRTADGQMTYAYTCPGGHKGPVMPLCKTHARDLSVGPPKPGYDSSMRPYGVIGGAKANELCPACAQPPEARSLTERSSWLQAKIGQGEQTLNSGILIPRLMREVDAARRELEDIAGQLTALAREGIVHRCPLILREVS